MASFLIIIVASLILMVVYCLFDTIRRKIKERVVLQQLHRQARDGQQQRPPLERTPHTINLGNAGLQVEMAKEELKARHKLLSEIVQLGVSPILFWGLCCSIPSLSISPSQSYF